MSDLAFIGLAIILFTLSAWYVTGCERLIGSEDAGGDERRATR
jgi:hypothetical protein